MNTTPLVRIAILLAAMAGLLIGLQAPMPADAAIRGTVDVCTIEIPKSWTKGLQRKANRVFDQRVRVHRVTEWTLADQPCDVYIWGMESRRQVGLYVEDDFESETIVTAKTKKQRPATIVNGLRQVGVR